MADPRIKTAIGPTILLQSGAYFDLLDPRNSAFTIEDIAHGLAMTCRFAGQCSAFYSVAEHSWHVSQVVARRVGNHGGLRLAALMHDAAEAFIGDVTRPLKSLLPAYKQIERNISAAIRERFNLLDLEHPEIKHADLQMLQVEQLAMMPHHDDRWSTDLDGPLLSVNINHWQPAAAREAFLTRYRSLGGRS